MSMTPFARPWIALAIGLSGSLLLTLPSTDAFAQDPACATTPVNHAAWRQAMDDIDATIHAFQLDVAREKLERTRTSLVCLTEIVRPSYLARFARQRALVAFYDQDEDSAVHWGLLSRLAKADLPWPADMPVEHPFRQMVEFADKPPVGGPEDATLLVEKKGSVFMNGAPLLAPRAEAEVPHLLQVTDKKGLVLSTFWQDGAAFPPALIGPAGDPLEFPAWFVPEAGAAAVVAVVTEPVVTEPVAVVTGPAVTEPVAVVTEPVVTEPVAVVTEPVVPEPVLPDPVFSEPDPPRETGGPNVIRLGIGGGLGVVAGTLYTIGAVMHGGAEDATADTLPGLRTRVNLMALGASLSGAAALGVGVTAFVSADGADLGLHLTW
jgi:hypothetical protein